MADFIHVEIEGRKLKLKDCRGLSSVRGLMFDSMEFHDGALIHANSVWMPFVRRRLTLFFLDSNMNVIAKQQAEPLTADPRTWKIYANSNAKYVAEVKD